MRLSLFQWWFYGLLRNRYQAHLRGLKLNKNVWNPRQTQLALTYFQKHIQSEEIVITSNTEWSLLE